MPRELSMDPKAIKQREITRRNRERKRAERAAQEGLPLPKPVESQGRKNERVYFIPLYVVDFLQVEYAGQVTTIGNLSDEQFRAWFIAVVDAALQKIKPQTKPVYILNAARLECQQYTKIDGCVKHDLINTLYEMKAFRDTGVTFVKRKEQAS